MRYKGRISKRSLAHAHPHQVRLRIPELGLGVRTDAIRPKVREIAGAAAADWPHRQAATSYAVHGFKYAEHAAAFRTWIAERWPELLESEPSPASERSN